MTTFITGNSSNNIVVCLRTDAAYFKCNAVSRNYLHSSRPNYIRKIKLFMVTA